MEDEDEDLDLMNAPDLDCDEEERNIDAYYYRFIATRCGEIDAVLEAVARAGRMFHHTSQWNESPFGGKTCVQEIQDAANKAATTLTDEREKYAALLVAVDAVLVSYHRGRLAEEQHELMYHLSEEREKVR